MANSSPAILPISNLQQSAATTADGQHSSAVRLFFAGISETVRSGLANRRHWPELVDRSAFSKLESVSEATLRISKNVQYFRINYFTIITAVLAISLLTNPFSLIVLTGLLASWTFLFLFRHAYDHLIALDRLISDLATIFFLVVSVVVAIFLTSVGSVLVSALMVSVAIVCAHGAFRVPKDLFLNEQEQSTGASGFLSFFTGTNAAISQPQVAKRVGGSFLWR